MCIYIYTYAHFLLMYVSLHMCITTYMHSYALPVSTLFFFICRRAPYAAQHICVNNKVNARTMHGRQRIQHSGSTRASNWTRALGNVILHWAQAGVLLLFCWLFRSELYSTPAVSPKPGCEVRDLLFHHNLVRTWAFLLHKRRILGTSSSNSRNPDALEKNQGDWTQPSSATCLPQVLPGTT